MAWNLCHMEEDLLCCVMDARRKQVYNALFEAKDGRPARLCPDRAVSLDDLAAELPADGRRVWLVGDGAGLCFEAFSGRPGIRLAPPQLRFQNAWGVARAALDRARRGETVTAEALAAVYLRLPQAERERLERLKKTKEPI
jgi:tRNA threonylcarbamoyladenosine biosynthesis protein TsaB